MRFQTWAGIITHNFITNARLAKPVARMGITWGFIMDKIKKVTVRSIGQRHSPPTRKNILTKTYPTPQTIVPVEIRNIVNIK